MLGRAGEEVAHDLGISRGTVKSRTYHAVRAMRRELGPGRAISVEEGAGSGACDSQEGGGGGGTSRPEAGGGGDAMGMGCAPCSSGAESLVGAPPGRSLGESRRPTTTPRARVPGHDDAAATSRCGHFPAVAGGDISAAAPGQGPGVGEAA
jgi:hypothetical protein